MDQEPIEEVTTHTMKMIVLPKVVYNVIMRQGTVRRLKVLQTQEGIQKVYIKIVYIKRMPTYVSWSLQIVSLRRKCSFLVREHKF